MALKAAVEALLRDRQLDRTLTSVLPEPAPHEVAPLGVESLDRALGGGPALSERSESKGLPRGQISEVVGPASSGRTSLAWAALGAATRRGESVALVDTFDRFDPPTGAACGIDLTRLLWVRGPAITKTTGAVDPAWEPGVRAVGGPGTLVERAIDRALKALNLVVQSGVCTLVAIDLVDVPAAAFKRLPPATWFRLARVIEGSDTAVLLVTASPVARSAGGRSIVLCREADACREGNACRERDACREYDPVKDRVPVKHSSPVKNQSPVKGRAPVSVLWKGSHDRSRRFGGVRTPVGVHAARWAEVAHAVVETSTGSTGSAGSIQPGRPAPPVLSASSASSVASSPASSVAAV
jgi:hypothetical protein